MIINPLGVQPARRLCLASFVPLFLTCAAFSVSVSATAAEQDNRAALEEIVVTARRQEESIQNVPIAVTALTTELEGAAIRNLTDLNGFAPNVVISEDGSRGGGGGNILIRGISPTRTDDNSFDATMTHWSNAIRDSG